MTTRRQRFQELACNAGCFLVALAKGEFRKLPFFAEHAIRAIVY